ncbi:MAG: thiamine phosphate synthase [Deltaproteobacteria bacterium]|nr:thiamine phosphate synthase [Deltaproteobacteria bacterium]
MFCSEKDRGVAKKQKIFGLYAIIDASLVDLNLSAEIAKELVTGGVSVIQLRAKGVSAGLTLSCAKEITTITKAAGVPFIINDRADIAKLSDADGIHLGQYDAPPTKVRELLGANAIIGLSTHNLKEAKTAEVLYNNQIIDYISVGTIFDTTTKKDTEAVVGLEQLREITSCVQVPVTAIGGINEGNLKSVLEARPRAVAIISDILKSKDIASKCTSLLNIIKNN